MKDKVFVVSLLVVCALGLCAAECPESFVRARPIWPDGFGNGTNEFFAFRANYSLSKGERPVLRVTSAYDYKARVNGAFIGFGPVRAARGEFRVDQWPLPSKVGENAIEIEVAGYNCESYYLMRQSPLLVAEIAVGDRILAATGEVGDFTAWTTGRVQKAPRFTGQRTFADVWRIGIPAKGPLPLTCVSADTFLPRLLPYPDFRVDRSFRPMRKERMTFVPGREITKAAFIEDGGNSLYRRFAVRDLESNPYYDLQRYEGRLVGGPFDEIDENEAITFVGDRNVAGFLGLRVSVGGPCRIVIAFDELLSEKGDVDFARLGCANVAEWRLEKPGEYELETFEPYAAKAIKVVALEGGAKVSTAPWVRTYESPLADRAEFRCSDPALEKIFHAACASYRANAVDGFTDCPLRERAYWTGDTFFTGRASAWLTGDAGIERLFLGNFLTGRPFDWSGYDSKGIDMSKAIPALYPGDVIWSNFIPNYMMWTVLQLDDYSRRFTDKEFVLRTKSRVVGVIDFLRKFKNADGLLEKLPGWVFVDWSHANDLVQDVNYPSSMMYAAVLEAAGHMYGRTDYTTEAALVRQEILRQSWNGEWFCDNAIRQADGSLKLTGERTEACQNFAFFFNLATPESHPVLWKRLVDEFGPGRAARKVYPEIEPCNFLFGTCIRLELLSRIGRSRQILEETRGWFLTMAERTGTLWEHLRPTASCCHGFSAIAAAYLFRDVLGVREIDRIRRTVRVQPAGDLSLDWCEGTIPVSPTETATVSWRKSGGVPQVKVRLPEGWMQASDSAGRKDKGATEGQTPLVGL